MRISVNLATKPFVELRPLLARLRIAMALLAVLALGLGVALHSLNRKASAVEAQAARMASQTAALQGERQRNEARMRQPANAAVLERSRFLNTVFARKSFSWTAVMMDLERVLPAGVQVTSIEPQVAGDGTVSIRLRVSGDRDRAVQLVRNLETSSRFLGPRLSGEAAQATNQLLQRTGMGDGGVPSVPGTVQFDILSGYNPLPERARTVPAAAPSTRSSVVQSTPASTAPRATRSTVRGIARPKPVVGGEGAR